MPRWRADWVAQSGAVTRRIIRILERPFPEFATCVSAVCGQAAHTVVEPWTVPAQLAAGPTAQLAARLARLSHGHCGAEQARAVQAAAHQRIGVRGSAKALACARRWLRRQRRELEPWVAAWDGAISRR